MSLSIPSWDEVFMRDVYAIARKSKDPRTKIGAVLVHWDERSAFSRGYNGFPRRVVETTERWERPEKYFWVKHAEENSILNCARKGHATEGSVMFTQGVPCSNCAGDIIQAGIIEVVVHKQWQAYEIGLDWQKWNNSAERSSKMFAEVGIKVRVFDQFLGTWGMLNGEKIEV